VLYKAWNKFLNVLLEGERLKDFESLDLGKMMNQEDLKDPSVRHH
jgi:hypothetical protein